MKKPIPEIVKEHILKTQGRMPETAEEIDGYLDLINHAKKYAEAIEMEQIMGKGMMKRFGFKTTDQIKEEGEILFKNRKT